MKSSGENWVLNKLGELANRCGLSPTVANVYLSDHWSDNGEHHWYSLSHEGSLVYEHQQEAMDKFIKLLGLDKELAIEFPDLESVEATVDHALALAPRARVRDR